MPRIIIDSDIPFVKGVLEPFAEVRYLKGTSIDRAAVRDADALIIRTRTKCTREMLEGSAVKLICTATIGTDHIDAGYCSSAEILVSNAAGCNARAVLQWVAASLVRLSSLQGWDPPKKHIGIVGCGHVGALVARYAYMWGFRVDCCDPPLQGRGLKDPMGNDFVTYENIARNSDIISFHVPLTRTGGFPTYHMAAGNFFEAVNKGAVVINSSRGEVIDTEIFRQAVVGGRCGAVIDTWEDEPYVDPVLLDRSLLATPHIAGYSVQGKANASASAVRSVSRFFGFPLDGWYPAGQPETVPCDISWAELRNIISSYFDIAEESQRLKTEPQAFEDIRNSYAYRREFF